MKRVEVTPRPDWQKRCEDVGFTFHTIQIEGVKDPTYWDESKAYEFTLAQVEEIESASTILYRMCLSAVDHVISNNLLNRLAIPVEFHQMVKDSWNRQDVDLYGRFDFALDANGVPKMLEFNADTPTSLLEAAVVQWYWMEDYARRTGQSLDQFNSIHETLGETLKDIGEKLTPTGKKFFFASISTSEEDQGTTEYLRDIAVQQGLNTQYINIEDIGWNGSYFTDLNEEKIETIFKLYPWEWLVREDFGRYMTNEPWNVVEPAWKLILSNKGILPILWELYPDHPNLLPAFWDHSKLGGNYVKKPLLSREGANITIVKDGVVANETLEGDYGQEGHIYQQYLPLPKFEGMTPIIGSWIVGGRSCGMGIREDVNEVTSNASHFIPHYFRSE